MLFREIENKGVDCRLMGYLLESEESNGVHNLLDMYFVSIGEGVVEMEIPVAPIHLNVTNKVHGGVMATLLDSVMGMAIKSCNKVAVTTNLNTSYLKSAGKGDVLKASGVVLRNGNKMLFCEAKVHNQHGDLLAIGTGNFFCTGIFNTELSGQAENKR